jgi:hypothetical protein
MIINIRGANGSGKSTAIRRFVTELGGFQFDTGCGKSDFTEVYVSDVQTLIDSACELANQKAQKEIARRRKPLFYYHERYDFVLLGHYETPCGGLDNIPYSMTFPLAHVLHQHYGSVILESMLFSMDVKWFSLLSESFDDIRIIYLKTTVERCLRQIEHRRATARFTRNKPVNVKTLRSNHKAIAKTREKIKQQTNIKCYTRDVDGTCACLKRWLCC